MRLGQEVQEVPRGIAGAAIAVLAAVGRAAGARPGQAESAQPTITISGRAYAFNHMDRSSAGRRSGSASCPPSGNHGRQRRLRLKVPDETNVTPYIDPRPAITRSTCRRSTPAASRSRTPTSRRPATPSTTGSRRCSRCRSAPTAGPQQCAIVTTASARDVRGVDYETFHARTPHGVAGATADAKPALAGRSTSTRRDPGPVPDGDLGRRRDHLHRGAGRRLRVTPRAPRRASRASSPPASRAGSSTLTRLGGVRARRRRAAAGRRRGRGLGGKVNASRRGRPPAVSPIGVHAAEPLAAAVGLRQKAPRVGPRRTRSGQVGRAIRLPVTGVGAAAGGPGHDRAVDAAGDSEPSASTALAGARGERPRRRRRRPRRCAGGVEPRLRRLPRRGVGPAGHRRPRASTSS